MALNTDSLLTIVNSKLFKSLHTPTPNSRSKYETKTTKHLVLLFEKASSIFNEKVMPNFFSNISSNIVVPTPYQGLYAAEVIAIRISRSAPRLLDNV